jgi:hypothetical protein
MATDLMASLRRHWFWVALALVLLAGYQLGKDRAVALNERDASAVPVGGH